MSTSLSTLHRTAAAALLISLSVVGTAAWANDPAAVEKAAAAKDATVADKAKGMAAKTDKAVGKGASAAASGVERGMNAAGRGVEKGAKKVGLPAGEPVKTPPVGPDN